MDLNLSGLITETRNKNTMKIDEASTLELVALINNEDKTVPLAVEREIPSIAEAVDAIYDGMSKGGRLIYAGAGTSGRLGVLDASECPPTYGASPDLVIGLMAGGQEALLKARENAEDSPELGESALKEINIGKNDTLVAISASGRTPFCVGAMNYAKKAGAKVISLCCNPESEMAKIADTAISVVVGPEAVTGSTRMKAGTAQKLVLNILSTGVMIKLGKVYGNLMVDVQPTNEKLVERAKRIVVEATGESDEAAKKALGEAGGNPKTAIVMLLAGVSAEEAKERLEKAKGRIKEALN